MKMKKVIVSLIAFLYLGISSGVAVEIHYCMGKKAGMELYGKGNDRCGKCGMKNKTSGCCKDEHKFYKLKDFHITVSNDLGFDIPAAFDIHNFQEYQYQPYFASITRNIFNHSPPASFHPPIYLLNCIFRI